MKIDVFLERENRKERVELPGKANVGNMLDRLGLVREAVLAVRGGILVTEDAPLKEGDKLKILSVVSGG